MLRCFSLQTTTSSNAPSSSSTSHPLQPTSNSLPNSPINLSHEFNLVTQTKSFTDIWSKIHPNEQTQFVERHVVNQFLQPNRESVHQALNQTTPNTLNHLILTYFNHSEQTSNLLCLLLNHSLATARSLYAPLHGLLEVLPLDSSLLSQPQCDTAFDIFLQFHQNNNPFPNPTSQTLQETRLCFSELKNQLDRRLRKARRRRTHIFSTSALCLTSLLTDPLHVSLPSKFLKQRLHQIAQLDVAAKGAYVLNNDLDTIDRLVARLHSAVESDKKLVGIGVERGRDRYPIQEVVKQLRKNHPNVITQLKDLEEHVCLCFATVNRARSLLLQEIRPSAESM